MAALSRFFLSMRPKTLPLTAHEKKLTTPHGLIEEGVIQYLFSKITPQTKTVVEIGAGNGRDFSLSRFLIQHNWKALLIEAHPKFYDELRHEYATHPRVQIRETQITRENCVSILESTEIPFDIDLLCIDIDGIDYYVWETLTAYHPSVICIEYNASYPPPQKFIVDYDSQFQWRGDDYHGASIQSYVELGKKRGYELVHVTSEGDNLFFVQKNLFGRFEIGDNSPERMYQIPQYGRRGRGRNGKGHPASPLTSTALTRFLLRLRYWSLGPLRFLFAQFKKI